MADLLSDILRLQEEVRNLEQELTFAEEATDEQYITHRQISSDSKTQSTRNDDYTSASPASIPAGQAVVTGPGGKPGEPAWGDYARNAPRETLERVPCADSAGCLDENFCYADYECAECDCCVDNTCQPCLTETRTSCTPGDKVPCSFSSFNSYECVCPEGFQWWNGCSFNDETNEFECVDEDAGCQLLQNCRNNSDCPEGDVCDNIYFYCVPGCILDSQCDPQDDFRAGDAISNGICVDNQCVLPCQPPKLCTPATEAQDCSADEYCAERRGRAATDPSDLRSAYECLLGCRDNSSCSPYVASDGTKYRAKCVNNSCVRECKIDSECAEIDGEGCTNGTCTFLGNVCIQDADCEDGQYCDADGRCQFGCRADSECDTAGCEKDFSCVQECPADPACTCEGDNCDEDFSWLDLCPRDPDCVRQCPADAFCLESRIEGATCVDGDCIKVCQKEKDCPSGWACVEGRCEKAVPGPETRIECKDVEICGADGVPGCYFEEQCVEVVVEPAVDDSRFGCGVGETCSQEGECVPSICLSDAECPLGSTCSPEGVCVGGCDDENPCPDGQACTFDGCVDTCVSDADCEGAEVCLADGLCGLKCDPIIICAESSQCPDGQYCGDNEICAFGCEADSDCDAGFACISNSCRPTCASDNDCESGSSCVDGLCERDPEPPCVNDGDCGEGSICKKGRCEFGCRRDAQCLGGLLCVDKTCKQPCENAETCEALLEGDACVNGFCEYINEDGESNGFGCGPGEQCDENGQCVPFDPALITEPIDFPSVDLNFPFTGQLVNEPPFAFDSYNVAFDASVIDFSWEGIGGGEAFENDLVTYYGWSKVPFSYFGLGYNPLGTVNIRKPMTGQLEFEPPNIGDSYYVAKDVDPVNKLVDPSWIGLSGLEISSFDLITWDGSQWNVIKSGWSYTGYNLLGSVDFNLSPLSQLVNSPPLQFDTYIVDFDAASIDFGWTGLGGLTASAGDLVTFDGSSWVLLDDLNFEQYNFLGLAYAGFTPENPSFGDLYQVGADFPGDYEGWEGLFGEVLEGDLIYYNGWELTSSYFDPYQFQDDTCPLGSSLLVTGNCGTCTGDQDCPGDQQCSDGLCFTPCLPPKQCEANQDCPDGFYCNDSNGFCESGCYSDAGCIPGQVCFDNQCSEPCLLDDDCFESELCLSGACVYRGTICEEDEDCLEDQACFGGYCIDDRRCAVNDDCNPGRACINGYCNVMNRCETRGDCMSGEYCVAGLCTTESACQRNENCDADKVCHDGRCKLGVLCASDMQCGDNQYCNQGLCVFDDRCLYDSDCDEGDICALGFCTADPAGSFFTLNSSCPAGTFCANDLLCRPDENFDPLTDTVLGTTCRSDKDCLSGEQCFNGECVQCTDDADCVARFQDSRLVCNRGICDTPCFTGLSDGDCFAGLQVGDTCENCPDSCPSDAPCSRSKRSCGTVRYYNEKEERWQYRAVPCQVCLQECTESSDCPDEYACYAGECSRTNGMCDSDDDCGEGGYCFNFECKAKSGSCFFESDCEPTERCVDGECREADSDTFEEGGVLKCPGGKIQKNGQCYMACDVPYLYCILSEGFEGTDSVPCPPGYICNPDLNRCTRDGYYGEEDIMGCATGEFCCEGACVPYKPFLRECCGDQDCGDGERCVSPSQEEPGVALCRAVDWDGTIEDVIVENRQELKNQETLARDRYNKTQLAYNQAKADYDVVFNPGYANDNLEEIQFNATDALLKAEADRDIAKAALDEFTGMWADFARLPYMPDNEITNEVPTDQTPQDTCEPRGLCCGDDGFCEVCPCSEDNPCENPTQCCDPESGKCVDLGDHPDTKYGAPGKCSFGDVYCEVRDCDNNSFTPSTAFDGPGFKWCEDVVVDVELIPNEEPHPYLGNVTIITYEEKEIYERKCYPGGEASESQVRTLLRDFCDCPDEDECDCEDVPEEAFECGSDADCGLCQRCVTRYVNSDPCCGRAYTVDGVEFDGVVVSVCEAIYQEGTEGYDENCQCETNDDCTECEVCEEGPASFLGETGKFCKPKCAELCPCGGETTNGQGCKGCEDEYGPCAECVDGEIAPAYVDETTGELIPAETRQTCRIKTENPCCEAFADQICTTSLSFDGATTCRDQGLDDLKKRRDGCKLKERVSVSGTKYYEQVDFCLDFEEGVCAECVKDEQCPGNAVCLNYQCVTECGQMQSLGGGDALTNALLPIQDCTCCTDAGDCRSINEAWTESRAIEEATDENGEPITGAECRPCQCTENGIDCKTYEPCESCYKWVRLDGALQDVEDTEGITLNYTGLNEAAAQARQEQVRQKVEVLNIQKEDIIERRPPILERLVDAGAVLQAANEEYATAGCDAAPGRTSCVEIQGKIAAANAEVSAANAELEASKQQETAVQDKIDILASELVQSYQPSPWVRERQCQCCIDGMCRPESDCLYGICYLCIDNSDPQKLEEMRYYRTAIYNFVKAKYGLWQLTCMGNQPESLGEDIAPDEARDKQVGANVDYWTFDSNTCVKYRCDDGLAQFQAVGSIKNTRFYEYCTGSIISCALSGSNPKKREEIRKKYKQGWDIEVNQEDAGLYMGNFRNGSATPEDFLYIAGPGRKSWETGCWYPNPNAHVRSHTLPTFIDTVYTHHCCSNSGLYTECDPEHPRCQLRFESFYESGDGLYEILRLERDIVALERYIVQLENLLTQLEELRATKEAELAELEAKVERDAAFCNNIFQRMNELETTLIPDTERLLSEKGQDIAGKEGDEGTESFRQFSTKVCVEDEVFLRLDCSTEVLDVTTTIKSGFNRSVCAQDALQEELDFYDLVVGERDRLVDERTPYEEQLLLLEQEKDLIELNRSLARTGIEENQREEQRWSLEAAKLDTQLQGLTPGTVEYENTLEDKNFALSEEARYKDLKESAEDQYDALTEQLTDIGPEITKTENAIRTLNQHISTHNNTLTLALSAVGTAREDLAAEKQAYLQLQQQLLAYNEELTGYEEVDFECRDKLTVDGSAGDYQAEADIIREVLINIEDSEQQVKDEIELVENESLFRREEILRLKEERQSSLDITPFISGRPGEGEEIKSAKELRELYKEIVEEAEEEEWKVWWPE